jgi:hypothetical protein
VLSVSHWKRASDFGEVGNDDVDDDDASVQWNLFLIIENVSFTWV